MIIKSFLRTKKNIIYLLIISLVFIILGIMLSARVFLTKSYKDYYHTLSLMYFELSKEQVPNLNAIHDLDNFHKTVLVSYHDGLFSKHSLEQVELNNQVLTYPDVNNTYYLNNDEVTIFLSSLNYENMVYKLNDYVNTTIEISFQNKTYNLKVKKILNGKHYRGLIINENLFDKMTTNSDNLAYTASFSSEDEENNIEFACQKEKIIVKNLTGQDSDDINFLAIITKYLNYLKIAMNVFTIAFVIVIIIVSINLYADSQEHRKLEMYLGYPKRTILFYQVKRFIVLYGFSFLLACSFLIIILLVALLLH